MSHAQTNPFLAGNFAPVREETEAHDLRVIGQLPRDMNGMFLRIGPNPQFEPIGKYHWFDGDGMLHGVRVEDGKASYRNRYVRTTGFEIERQRGRAIWSGLMEPPQFDNPDGPFKNAANTALVWHDGRLLALWEGGEPHHIKVPGLETVGPYDYNGKLVSAFTAHPKVDAVTGEMMFFGYSPMPPYLQYSVVAASGELLRTVPIDIPAGVMMHDCAVTEHYTLLLDLPVTFNMEAMATNEPLLNWNPDNGARIGVIPRHGANDDVKWFEIPPCYIFHTANAYEEGDEVVLIACRLNSTDVLMDAGQPPKADQPAGQEDQAPRMHRWRFNMRTGAVKEDGLDDVVSEFPRINEALTGRLNRYSYSARVSAGATMPLFDGFQKYDHQRATIASHRHGKGRYGGEGVFVLRDGASAEDDGWIVTYVHDETNNSAEMVVVNAQDITAEPVARVLIPSRVPYGFHGAWVPGQYIADQHR